MWDHDEHCEAGLVECTGGEWCLCLRRRQKEVAASQRAEELWRQAEGHIADLMLTGRTVIESDDLRTTVTVTATGDLETHIEPRWES